MKLANVILAIVLWLCIPFSFIVGIIFGLFATLGGSTGIESVCCTFILPIILFILGVLILYMGRDKLKPTIDESRDRIPDRRCPNCARIIPFDAKVCPYCSKRFED